MRALKCIAVFCLLLGAAASARAEVLIVADEFPAMEVVAAKLKSAAQIDSRLVWQTNLPPDLAPFQAVIVYIHEHLTSKAENAFIDYTKTGGRLVLLHHAISSVKRTNENWFSFLGVSLPLGDLQKGGYKYFGAATWSLVDLNPRHFIMTNQITWPETIPYASTKVPTPNGTVPGFTLTNDEVYLNHVPSGARTLLMGLKYTEPKTGVTYMQDTAGWFKPAGKGWIVYLMPGHRKVDFEDPTYGQIVVNAVISPL